MNLAGETKNYARRLTLGCVAAAMMVTGYNSDVRADVQTYQGRGCESLAVFETLVATRDAAYEKARFDALQKAGVNLQQLLQVEDFVLTKQEVSSVSAGTLSNINITSEYKDDSGQNFCVELTADADPDEMRQQFKDREKFAADMRRRTQFVEAPVNAQCASEVSLDSTHSFPMYEDEELADYRDKALATAKVEAIGSVQYTVVNSFTDMEVNEKDGDISQRYVQRMKARAGGMARATIWREAIGSDSEGDVAQFDVVTMVCVPKDPSALPMPVYVGGVINDKGESDRELTAIFADSFSKDPQIYLVNDPDIAEVTVRAEVQSMDLNSVQIGRGQRLPAGSYELVKVGVAGQGQDVVTGKSFAEVVDRARHFNTKGFMAENADKLTASAVRQLATQMMEETLLVYRGKSAEAKKPAAKDILF